MPDLKVGEVEELLEGLYIQREEIKVSKVMYKLLLQSEQVVVKPNILDDDVKMEPKAIPNDEDNGLCEGDLILFEDDHLEDGHNDIGLDRQDAKEDLSREEKKKDLEVVRSARSTFDEQKTF